MVKRYVTNCEEETILLGEKFAKSLKCGDVIALYGCIGAGKTVFAKGVAKGLGIKEDVTSPTFSLMKHYMGRLPLYHFDLYRIESAEELPHIGFYDYLGGDNVCIIEWAENAEDVNPGIKVRITGKGNDIRTINISEG